MLTRRGRKVRGFLIGALVGFTIWFLNGFWWDCDLRAGATTPCRVIWQTPFVSAN